MILGTGGALNTHHEGPVKRSTEEIALTHFEGAGSRAVSSGKPVAPMNNPAFLGGEGEKGK